MNPLVTYACVISAGTNGLAVLGPDLLEHLECGNLTEAASTAGALTTHGTPSSQALHSYLAGSNITFQRT